MPDKYESGTPNTPGIAGLAAALDFLADETIENIRDGIRRRTATMLEGLDRIERVRLFGPSDAALNVGIVSLVVAGQDAAEVAHRLERQFGILTRVGLHCAPSAHKTMGTYPHGTIRTGIGCFTTDRQVAHLLNCLAEICDGD